MNRHLVPGILDFSTPYLAIKKGTGCHLRVVRNAALLCRSDIEVNKKNDGQGNRFFAKQGNDGIYCFYVRTGIDH